MEEIISTLNIEEQTELEKDIKAREMAVAVPEKKQNIMLSAAAGSGKTYTLVQRIANHVIHLPKDKHIDGFTVVTFTKAAASELAEKIGDKLSKIYADDTEDYTEEEKKRAYNESLLVEKAMIGTIDSFCLDIVEKNFAKLSISPKISIEESENSFINDVIDKVLEIKYGGDKKSPEYKALSKLVDIFGDINGDEGLKTDLIIPVLNLMNSLPNPKAWLSTISTYYEEPVDIKDNIWYKKLKDVFIIYTRSCLEHAKKLENRILNWEYDLDDNCHEKYLRCVQNDEEALNSLLSALNNDKGEVGVLFTDFIYLKLEGWPVIRTNDEDLKAEKNEAKGERDLYKEVIIDLSEDCFGKYGEKTSIEREKQFCEGIKKISRYVRVVLDICGEVYDEAFDIAKQKNKYTFSQIAHLALSALIDGEITNEGVENLKATEVAISYRKKFSEIYIDEYQDTTLLQEYIMYIVSGIQDGENNLFNVGDVKQSIYRFRNATPKLFIDKYDAYKMDPEKGLLLTLSRNFRCRRGIINGTNDVFKKIMTLLVSDIDYNDGHKLTFGAKDDYDNNPFPTGEENGKCELIVCQKPSAKEETETKEDEEEDNTPVEYGVVAEKIIDLFQNKFLVVDKESKQARPLRFSDICILSRNNKNLNNTRSFLKNCGFPCDAISDRFFDAGEVIDVLSFLRVVDNPHNDIEIVSLMKSMFFNFTDTELAQIATRRKNLGIRGDFYDAICKLSKEEWELSEKLTGFLEEVGKVRKLSLEVPISELVWYVIKYKEYYTNCGEIEKGNLRILQEEAFPFDSGINGGLYSFLVSVDKKIESERNNPRLSKQSYVPPMVTTDKIKFMTVHGSKGLEFPIVFMVGTEETNPNKSGKASVDVENGIGFPVDFGRKIEHSGPFNVIRETNKIENLKEKQRLLYVGLTRAREKLFILGTSSNKFVTTYQNLRHEPIISELSIRKWNTFFKMVAKSCFGSSSWKTSFYTEETIKSGKEYKEMLLALENISNNEFLKPETEKDEIETEQFLCEPESTYTFREICEELDNGTLPLKLSVSSLKHYSVDENGNTNDISIHPNDLRELPNFEKKQGTVNSGAAFGTLMHTAMRFLVDDRKSFDSLTAENVEGYIERFIHNQFLMGRFSEEEETLVDREMLKKFLLSDTAKEISKAEQIRCEIPFTFMTDINKYLRQTNLEKEIEKPNCLAIQGVIDLYYKFNGRIVILDYKTDKLLTEKSMNAYKVQLMCYADALEKISGECVSDKVLFHLRDGRRIEV